MDIRKTILIAFVFSGMAALIYEIVWIRPIQYLIGSTIYTVSIIFAAFLGGLALGAWVAAKYVDKIGNLPKAYAIMEMGIGLYGVLLLSVFNFLPQIYRTIYGLNQNFFLFGSSQLLLSFLILLIPTTLMGATFPVIAKFYTKEKIGKGIGEVYSANNLGAILGSFTAGFVLIPLLGIKFTVVSAGLINILIASVILLASARQLSKKIIPAALAVFLILSFAGSYEIQNFFTGSFYRANFPQELLEDSRVLFYKEGLHATVNVVEEQGVVRSLLINGKGQGGYALEDMRVNLLLAYLPLLIKPDSQNALVIGLGTGTTAGQLSQFVGTTTVEIEPTILEAAEYFKLTNLNATANPNNKIIIDDGRNYLLRSKEKYDVIIPEPSDPWQSFSTAFYSKEFFELAKSRLNENGLYMQWVPIFEMTPEDFRSFYRTFSSVFPYVVAFGNLGEDEFPGTTEIILVGSKNPVNYQNIGNGFDLLPDFSRRFFDIIRIGSSQDLLDLMVFTGEQMAGYGKDSPIITDDNARLELSTAVNIFVPLEPRAVLEDIKVQKSG